MDLHYFGVSFQKCIVFIQECYVFLILQDLCCLVQVTAHLKIQSPLPDFLHFLQLEKIFTFSGDMRESAVTLVPEVLGTKCRVWYLLVQWGCGVLLTQAVRVHDLNKCIIFDDNSCRGSAVVSRAVEVLICTSRSSRVGAGQVVVVSGDHSVHMLTCGDGCRCLHVGRSWLQAYQEWQGPGLVAGLGAVGA